MRPRTRVVVHVTLDDPLSSGRPSRELEQLLEETARLERCLARHGRGWERPSADEAVLATSAPWKEEPGAAFDWAKALSEDVYVSIGRPASVGIASTPLAARVASRLARPRGVLLLLSGYEDTFIESAPLEELDELRADQAAALRRSGIRSLGELARLDPARARSLMGAEAAKLLGLVRGRDAVGESGAGGGRQKAIAGLCVRAARRLAGAGLRARGVELRIAYGDGVVLERYRIAPSALRTARELERAAGELLALFPTRPERVAGISLTLTGLGPAPGQLPLFSDPSRREITVRCGREVAEEPSSG